MATSTAFPARALELGDARRLTVPVLSLCIYRDESREEVLLGVRKPTITSPRHPGVLSTPTMRLPWPLMDALLEPLRVDASDVDELEGFEEVRVTQPIEIGVADSMSNPLSFAVESMMARKLGWGDALVRGDISATAQSVAIARADVDGCEMDETEDTFMLTVEIVLRSEVSLAATASFSRLDWVARNKIDTALELDDPYLLIKGGEPWEVCLHGLCVRSAAFAGRRAA